MHTAIMMLGWSVALGLLQIALVATFSVASPALGSRRARSREAAAGRVGGRLERTSNNFLETFPLFAVGLLAALLLAHTGVLVVLGAQLYVWGWLAYLPLYAAGIPWLRTLAWAVSIAGVVLVLIALL